MKSFILTLVVSGLFGPVVADTETVSRFRLDGDTLHYDTELDGLKKSDDDKKSEESDDDDGEKAEVLERAYFSEDGLSIMLETEARQLNVDEKLKSSGGAK